MNEISTSLETIKGTFDDIIQNVSNVIVGKSESVELTVLALMCGGHVLLEDVSSKYPHLWLQLLIGSMIPVERLFQPRSYIHDC